MTCLSRLDRTPGGDTDTVAAVTGAPAGAVHGVGAARRQWTGVPHVPLPEFGGQVLRAADPARRPAS